MNNHALSSSTLTRRSFLTRSALAALATSCTSPFWLKSARAATPAFTVTDTKVISLQPEYYIGWPTVTRRSNGELWLAYSGGREGHVCPFGQVQAMTSKDNGETWTWPRVLLDGAIDDRDAGALETDKGTLLVSTFTSLAYEPGLAAGEKSGKWAADKLARWQGVHNRLSAAERKAELGQWMIRSTDGGTTWSERYPTIVNSPHGPIQLRDGRQLYAGKQLWTGGKRNGICESVNDGKSWDWVTELPVREGDKASEYHELHAVEADNGKIIVHIRNHNKPNAGETLQTESADGGRTWTEPHTIGVWGLPSHLLKLKDGRLLMTYGHRRAPLGNQARLSTDHGSTWSEPMILSGDGNSGDLGYPSTVQLADGSLLTVWYELMKGSSRAVLRQARWKLS
jgi:hypothetical protein